MRLLMYVNPQLLTLHSLLENTITSSSSAHEVMLYFYGLIKKHYVIKNMLREIDLENDPRTSEIQVHIS